MHSIRGFAISLIAIFIPIYMLQQGFSLINVCWYIATIYFFLIPTSYLAMKIASKIGIKKAFWISLPLTLIFILTLNYMTAIQTIIGTTLTIIIISIVQAMQGSMYWMPYHTEFVKFSNQKKGAKQLGIANILSSLTKIAAPLIGAITIAQFSYPIIFITVAILLIIAFTPMIFSKDDHEPFNFKLQKFTTKRLKNYVIPYFAEGLYHPAVAFFWPILLYFLFTSLPKMGGLYVASDFA
ncbi:MFS transporter [Candidatus Woesearchaeota archaeon]|nr:MFS transporter [Candidatus Woesearchaeota archaeon]